MYLITLYLFLYYYKWTISNKYVTTNYNFKKGQVNEKKINQGNYIKLN